MATSDLHFKTTSSGSSMTEDPGKEKTEAPGKSGIRLLSRDMRTVTLDTANRDEDKVTHSQNI